jgi:Inner membrane component of T3SS, cytoplasmic domain/Domain of unknown function (DUF4388)
MALALRFISGKYQGGEFPLEENREVLVGRSSDLDMVLVEEMVSRKHARLQLSQGRIEIEDLGSTNGTFVNGERITRMSVGEGDRILIGSNILRVVSLDADGAKAPVKPNANTGSNRRVVRRFNGVAPGETRMSGSLEDIPLPDLLQLFGSSKKDGILLIDSGISVGRVVLKAGIVHFAQIDREGGGAEPLPPLKAVYRMLTWETGVFELDPLDDQVYSEVIDLSVQEVLMEAFRQKDELAQLHARLPLISAKVSMIRPLEAKLSDLGAAELDVLQLAYNRGTLGGSMDTSPLSDLDTAKALVRLIEQGYLQIDP